MRILMMMVNVFVSVSVVVFICISIHHKKWWGKVERRLQQALDMTDPDQEIVHTFYACCGVVATVGEKKNKTLLVVVVRITTTMQENWMILIFFSLACVVFLFASRVPPQNGQIMDGRQQHSINGVCYVHRVRFNKVKISLAWLEAGHETYRKCDKCCCLLLLGWYSISIYWYLDKKVTICIYCW